MIYRCTECDTTFYTLADEPACPFCGFPEPIHASWHCNECDAYFPEPVEIIVDEALADNDYALNDIMDLCPFCAGNRVEQTNSYYDMEAGGEYVDGN